MSGIAFIAINPGPIGETHPEHKGKSVSELDTVFQILSDNRESLEVLKATVQTAIDDLDEMQNG